MKNPFRKSFWGKVKAQAKDRLVNETVNALYYTAGSMAAAGVVLLINKRGVK